MGDASLFPQRSSPPGVTSPVVRKTPLQSTASLRSESKWGQSLPFNGAVRRFQRNLERHSGADFFSGGLSKLSCQRGIMWMGRDFNKSLRPPEPCAMTLSIVDGALWLNFVIATVTQTVKAA